MAVFRFKYICPLLGEVGGTQTITAQDLNKRLGESQQFKELKSIIAKKNLQIKELREKLGKYETDGDDGVVIAEED